MQDGEDVHVRRSPTASYETKIKFLYFYRGYKISGHLISEEGSIEMNWEGGFLLYLILLQTFLARH